MPEGLEPEEQSAYQAMRYLYTQYRYGEITRNKAMKERNEIRVVCRKKAEERRFFESRLEHFVRIWNMGNNGASEFRLAETDEDRLKAAKKMLEAIEGRG